MVGVVVLKYRMHLWLKSLGSVCGVFCVDDHVWLGYSVRCVVKRRVLWAGSQFLWVPKRFSSCSQESSKLCGRFDHGV